MLKKLRLRLSLLYLFASLSLVVLLSAVTYGLLSLYFQRATDLALNYKMAIEFRTRGIPLPMALASAEQAWVQTGNRSSSAVPQAEASEEEEEKNGFLGTGDEGDERFDGSLAPVFTIPDTGGIFVGGQLVAVDTNAIAHALQTGSDLRTIKINEDKRLRLLTYSLGNGDILQMGRLLTDQDRLLSQYLVGLLIVGSFASLLLAVASWVLAGRSIKPAQTAWDQQQQFISNASHELRTPLTILRANADYALRTSDINERENSLHDIIGEVDYMNKLVEDLLLLSRLDANRLVLTLETINLHQLLNEVAGQMEKLASVKRINIEVGSAQGVIHGDKVRMRQVLLILLDNALRFTPPEGSIHVASRIQGHEALISVMDTGAGIPPADLSHVFDRFYQVPGQSDDGRGNGLGLSIAKGLVEAHGGSLGIVSQPGQGTTVQIHLPSVS